jgi:hypothetical protein
MTKFRAVNVYKRVTKGITKGKGDNQYSKQERQGKVAFNERNSYTTQQQGPAVCAQEDPKQKQDRAQGRARTGQSPNNTWKEIITDKEIKCN